jgi:hypothetical protein
MSFASFLKHYFETLKIRQMRPFSETRTQQFAVAFRAGILAAAIAFGTSWALAQSPTSQPAATSDDTTPRVVLKKLYPPLNPGIAQADGTGSDVTIRVIVRADGSVESVTPLSGEQFLQQAVSESAAKSQFECRGCSGLTEKILIYTFRVLPGPSAPCCCTAGHDIPTRGTEISELEGHITITYPPSCMCPDECTLRRVREESRFRSAKCLYLWKCGDHHYMAR